MAANLGFYADPCKTDCGHSGVEQVPVGPDFHDPMAWGFCRFCAFLVATTLEEPRTMLFHRPVKGNTDVGCPGSDRPVDLQPGKEAAYIKQVSLYKTMTHLAERKRRHMNLLASRRIAMYVNVTPPVGPVVTPAAGVDTYGPIENPEN